MEQEQFRGNEDSIKPEKIPGGASDMELTLFLIEHIDNPCETKVAGVRENIREFYMREAREVMKKMTNPHAKELLGLKLNEYEGQ